MAVFTLFVGNTGLVEVKNLTDVKDGSAQTGYTGTATIFDSEGAQIGSPITLDDDGGGDYSGVVPDDLDVADDDRLVAEVELTDGAGSVGKWELNVVVKTRRQ